MHQFETLSVPLLKRADAAYGTPRYVVHTLQNGGSTGATPALVQFDVRFIQACDDEPPAKNNAAMDLQRLWLGGIHAGAAVAAYRLVVAGQTNAPPVCYDFVRAAARDAIAQELQVRGFSGFNPNAATTAPIIERMRVFRSTPYYAHIVALWSSAMAALGMSFPGFDHTYTYSMSYDKALDVIREHLPNGVHCQSANFYVLNGTDAGAPSAAPQ